LIKSEKIGLELHDTSHCQDLKEKFGPLIKSMIEAHKKQESHKQKAKKSR